MLRIFNIHTHELTQQTANLKAKGKRQMQTRVGILLNTWKSESILKIYPVPIIWHDQPFRYHVKENELSKHTGYI